MLIMALARLRQWRLELLLDLGPVMGKAAFLLHPAFAFLEVVFADLCLVVLVLHVSQLGQVDEAVQAGPLRGALELDHAVREVTVFSVWALAVDEVVSAQLGFPEWVVGLLDVVEAVYEGALGALAAVPCQVILAHGTRLDSLSLPATRHDPLSFAGGV